jgi:hypothetical protein
VVGRTSNPPRGYVDRLGNFRNCRKLSGDAVSRSPGDVNRTARFRPAQLPLVLKIAATLGIPEEDLCAAGIFKATPEKSAEKPSVKYLVIGGPLPSAEHFIAVLKAFGSHG